MDQPAGGYTLGLQVPEAPLTARGMQDFSECPRKFLLSHFAPAHRSREIIGGPAALGGAVRAALVELYAAGSPRAFALDRLLACFESYWNGALCADSLEEETLHSDGVRMLTAHHAAPLELGDSLRVDLHLEEEIGGYRFAAVADVLGADPCQVVRVTTARRPPSAAALAEDVSYGLLLVLARRALREPQATGLMLDLRRGRCVPYAMDATGQEAFETRVAALAARIRREREFAPAKGPQCRWCRSRSQCPAWANG